MAVHDETDVADLFRQHFRREVQGECALHFACSGEDALGQLDKGIEPQLIVILSDINKGRWNFCPPCSPLRPKKTFQLTLKSLQNCWPVTPAP